MTTRTQIIKGLKAAKHEHSLDCKYQLRHGQACCCTCNAKRPNAAIAAAITWIEKQEAVQAEPVAYPSADQAIQWRAEWFRVGEGDEPPFIAARAIDWYRSQHPAPVQQAGPMACKCCIKNVTPWLQHKHEYTKAIVRGVPNSTTCKVCGHEPECHFQHPPIAPADEQPVGDPLPERDVTRTAEHQGLFRKFIVTRTDGSDKEGGKHQGCEYFVLDVKHDQHANAALWAYAESCKQTHPELSSDMKDRYSLRPVSDAVWTQGVAFDGAVFLKDGVMQTIEDVLAVLNATHRPADPDLMALVDELLSSVPRYSLPEYDDIGMQLNLNGEWIKALDIIELAARIRKGVKP